MKKKQEEILTIAIIITIFGIGLFGSQYTGFTTFDSQSEVNWDDMQKAFNLTKNQEFSLKIDLPGYKFSDNTHLFDITEDGLIKFSADQTGDYRVVIVALNENEEVLTKVIRFRIE